MDRETLETLVRTHQAEVYRYVRYLGADPTVAEDLVQDTFLGAYTQARAPDVTDPRAGAAWLRGIARNKFLMHCRRDRIDSAAVERAEELWRSEFLREGDGFDYLEALRECLSQLSDRQRSLLTLFYRGGKSRGEVAAIFHLGEDGVKSMLRRLRRALGICVRKRLGLEAV